MERTVEEPDTNGSDTKKDAPATSSPSRETDSESPSSGGGSEGIPESLQGVVGSQVAISDKGDEPVVDETEGDASEHSFEGAALWATEEKADQDDEEDSISSPPPSSRMAGERPSYRFFGVVAALSLIADITTKVWAEVVINQRGFEPIQVIGNHVNITLAYNQGGAWGLFSTADEMVRKPFFLCVSAFAIFFIISLYSRLHPTQTALKWGLPLVLGGALGNLSDRITRSQVIDFIDYQADWVMTANSFVKKFVDSWAVTNHWPTFNVADIAIVIGVGLMAVDMFTHRPRSHVRSAGSSHSPSEAAPKTANSTAL